MVFNMRELFGRTLVTRAAGNQAYKVISEAIDRSKGVAVFDFSGIDSVTNSFADEVFGRLVSDRGMNWMRNNTSFKNVNRSWAMVIRGAMDSREQERCSLAV